MTKIIWSYYGKPTREPSMGAKLRAMVLAAAENSAASRDVDMIHIDHAGTVPDPRHKAKRSYHNYSPPQAIDILQFGPWDVRTDLAQRSALKTLFDMVTDGRAHYAHVDDLRCDHIHLQSGPGPGVKGK